MGGSGSLTEFLTGCIVFLALALYFSCRQCVKLERREPYPPLVFRATGADGYRSTQSLSGYVC